VVPSVSATFICPCPAPNLVVTDLTLLSTGTISTYQPLDFQVTVANIGTEPVNRLFWVDLLAAEPVTRSVVWTAVSGLEAGTSRPLTVTLQSGFPTTGTYHISAFVDSWHQVLETNEEDNEGGPITVDVTDAGEEPPSPITGTGSIAGETWVSLTGIPVPHGRTDVYVYTGATLDDAQLVASTVSDDEGIYEVTGLPAGSYIVVGETWIDSVRYSRTYYNVTVYDDQTTVLIIIMYEG